MTQIGRRPSLENICNRLKAQKMNEHKLKTYSGHHILSYHSTQNTPRAYVGKPTCLFVISFARFFCFLKVLWLKI